MVCKPAAGSKRYSGVQPDFSHSYSGEFTNKVRFHPESHKETFSTLTFFSRTFSTMTLESFHDYGRYFRPFKLILFYENTRPHKCVVYSAMEPPQLLALNEGLELTSLQMSHGQLVLHVTATSSSSLCPLCAQPATRLHSRYRHVVKDLPCAGQQVQLILHVRKFFCDTANCARKICAERLPELVAPWAHMTARLCQAIQAIGLASCGRLGARLASRLGILTSWMTIVRRVMALPTKPAEQVQCLGIDEFSDLSWQNIRHGPGGPGHPSGHRSVARPAG